MSEKKLPDILVEKSINSFLLAIELFNRPTLKNRVESFAFLICNAWELLLKAKIILDKGSEGIYYPDSDRTYTLDYCLKLIITNENDLVRLNLEKIIDLRNSSTHFIIDEYHLLYVPFFQSNIFNYIDYLKKLFNIEICDYVQFEFLNLVLFKTGLDKEKILNSYGPQVLSQFEKKASQLIKVSSENNDSKLEIGFDLKLLQTKNAKDADIVAQLSNKDGGEMNVKVVEKIKDVTVGFPYSSKQCLNKLNELIKKNNIEIYDHNNINLLDSINNFHLTMMIKYYKIKEKPQYCYKHIIGKTIQFTYSEEFIKFVIAEIAANKSIFFDIKKKIKS
jgi:hypothetical protein